MCEFIFDVSLIKIIICSCSTCVLFELFLLILLIIIIVIILDLNGTQKYVRN